MVQRAVGLYRRLLKEKVYDTARKKTEEYLLNVEHPSGGSKAKFFVEVLGYSRSNSKQFHDAIYDAIKGRIPDKTENSSYGIKHTYYTKIRSASGKIFEANVVIVIQKDNGRITYKVVTVYPNKR